MTKENDIAIRVENVSKTFRIPHEKISSLRGAFVNMFHSNGCEEFKALDDVSFEVKKGEFFGIIGRNGSGKSTLLKILAGIYQPDKGKVKINGLVSPFLELGIGFNPELSGRDNIYLNAAVLGLSHKQIDEKFDDIVDFSELRRFIDQKVKNYSSGMQVRLAFSVAIHANRDILLMDEVLAVGDSNFQGKCMEEFNRYKDQGKTVILVTHDTGTVQRYCDRAMLLRNGKIEMIGDPEKVGNEYIYQNMSDEERRIFDDELRNREKAVKGLKNLTGIELVRAKKLIEEDKKIREEERKNRVAEIIDINFLNKDGKVVNVTQTGNSLLVQVKYKIHKPIREINIGIGLYSETNERIFGYNTQMDNFRIENDSSLLNLYFDSLPILRGTYYLNAVCFGQVEQTCYDLKLKFKTLKVFSSGLKNKYRGLFDIKHKWKNQNFIL